MFAVEEELPPPLRRRVPELVDAEELLTSVVVAGAAAAAAASSVATAVAAELCAGVAVDEALVPAAVVAAPLPLVSPMAPPVSTAKEAGLAETGVPAKDRSSSLAKGSSGRFRLPFRAAADGFPVEAAAASSSVCCKDGTGDCGAPIARLKPRVAGNGKHVAIAQPRELSGKQT